MSVTNKAARFGRDAYSGAVPTRTDYKACAAPKPSVLLDGEEGAMDWVACVGVDWGDKKHAYAIRARDGTKSAGIMGSSAEEVHEWARALREQFPTGMIVLAPRPLR